MNQLPNLLIVDDTEENLMILESMIRKINVNLIKAHSGQEALVITQGTELALAIVDIWMPGMNGYELAMKLNEERPGNKLPIIFLTASRIDEIEVFKGYDTGAVDYISKPVHNRVLLSKINVFLDLFNQKQTIIRDAALLKESADELTMANTALKKSEEKYKSYIEGAPDGVFVADENGKYIEVNEAASKITGYSKEELLKMSVSDILPEESHEDSVERFRKVTKTCSLKADLMFRHKNGIKRWWTLEVVKLSESRFLVFAKDITQRKEMEESLRTYQIELEMQNNELVLAKEEAEASSQKYADLYNFAPSGYFTLSADKEIKALNYTGSKMLGLNNKRTRLIDNHFNAFISKKTLPKFNDLFLKVFQNKNKETCEVVLETEDDQPKYVHIEGIVSVNGKQCLLNVVDITERKQAEQILKISEEKYKTMLNASPDGILLISLNDIITEVSEIGLELFGADSRDDLVGKNLFLFVPDNEKNTVREIFERTMNEGLAQNIELKFKKKNQSLFAAETSATLIQNPNGSPLSFMIIIRDISQRKKTEAKQIHADRMANLGEMATGIAHEINQPLNIISMVMDKILFETTKSETIDIEFLKKKSDRIFDNITRIRNIIDHIRAFSRSHDDYVLTAFDINASIENATSMVAEQFKHLGINLNLQLEKQIPQIVGNTYQFEQIIVNLLINAKDAVIEKKSQQEDYCDMIIGIKTYQENQFLNVEITDNGIGISNEDIHNIVLPFYTTKDEGKGTGLGLSICYQIIKEMNGTIDIISDKFKGTLIKLILDIQKKK